MKLYMNIIFAILIFLTILTFKAINTSKQKNCFKAELFYKTRKIVIALYIIAFVIFIGFLWWNLKTLSLKDSLVYAISIAILFLPLSINTLYTSSFQEEEKYSHIKYVISNDYDKKYIKLLNKAGIKFIYLTNDKKAIPIKEITSKDLNKNILSIKADDPNNIFKSSSYALRKIKDSYYDESTKNAYEVIRVSRGVHDNFIRTIKFNFTIYLSLFLTIATFIIQGFPLYLNIFSSILFKLLTYLASEYVYKYLKFDTDIMYREPKEKNRLFSFQEGLILAIESFCICFTLVIPYMFILANGSTISLPYTILTITLIYIIIWYTYAIISEKIFIKNFIDSIKSVKLLIIALGMITITIIINILPKTGFTNVGFKNYFVAVLISLTPMLFLEFTKLARYSSREGRKKNES